MPGDTKRAASVSFVVKDISARELRLATGRDLQTVADLRTQILMHWQVPRYLQRIVAQGKTFTTADRDNTPLSEILADKVEQDQDRITWLIWMSDDDYIAIDRGGLINHATLERKTRESEARGRTLQTITLGTCRKLAPRITARYDDFRGYNSTPN